MFEFKTAIEGLMYTKNVPMIKGSLVRSDQRERI